MKLTLERYLTTVPDGELLDIENEILSEIVPASGYAHKFCRKINKMIDAGEMCINPTTYRKVYLPVLIRAVNKELARRYITGLENGYIVIGGNK